MTPEEEELMRIYKDGVYQPPYMIQRSGGFQIRRFCVKPGRPVVSLAEDYSNAVGTALGQAAFPKSVVEAAEDEPDAGDAALGETALHGPVIEASEG